jgi:hypothetical protein
MGLEPTMWPRKEDHNRFDLTRINLFTYPLPNNFFDVVPIGYAPIPLDFQSSASTKLAWAP